MLKKRVHIIIFLSGFYEAYSSGYDDWIEEERRRSYIPSNYDEVNKDQKRKEQDYKGLYKQFPNMGLPDANLSKEIIKILTGTLSFRYFHTMPTFSEWEGFALVVQKITWIKGLDLSFHDLKGVPKDLGHIHHLRHLNLQGNCIQALPKAIACLTSLKSLNLRDNWLTRFPAIIVRLTTLPWGRTCNSY